MAEHPIWNPASPVENSALASSIKVLDAWEARADGDYLTQEEGESIALVLHELKRLRLEPPRPSVAAPSFMGTPLQKLESLLKRGYAVTGYAVEKHVEGVEPSRGFINAGGLVGWWHSHGAPQSQPRSKLGPAIETKEAAAVECVPQLQHALRLALELPVARYLMSNAHGRASGSEKAQRHEELCRFYVATFHGVSLDEARRDELEPVYRAVHTRTQQLTDRLDEAIGFPLHSAPDYDGLAPKFFAEFHRLAIDALGRSSFALHEQCATPYVQQIPLCDVHLSDQELTIGKLEDAVLGAMEEHDGTYAAWYKTRADLARMYEGVLAAWLYDGALIDVQARKQARCLLNINVLNGASRGATSFRVVGLPSVTISGDGDPALTRWSCKAVPISPKTGRDMSGRPGNSVRDDASVTLQGSMWHFGFSDLRGADAAQAERDEFIEMVATAEATLITREAQGDH